jgi:prophage regulatory protein
MTNNNEKDKPSITYLRIKHVLERVSLSRSTLYNLIAQGAFPRPVPLSARAVCWLDQDIDTWMLERLAARDRA